MVSPFLGSSILSVLGSLVSGLFVGSFLNVLIYRLPRGEGWVWGRSRCPQCQHVIPFWDNIPLLSFLILRGRCRFCQSPISFRYPMIEFLTALLFFAVQKKLGWSLLLICSDWPWVSLLIAMTFIDLEHRIIPDVLSLSGLVLGCVTAPLHPSFVWPGITVWSSLGGALFGFLFFYLLSELYYRFTGREGLGGGDVKLLAMLGAFLGPAGVFFIVLTSSLLGSLVGILWAGFSRDRNLLQFSIPYGPFLVLGALFYYLLGDQWWFSL